MKTKTETNSEQVPRYASLLQRTNSGISLFFGKNIKPSDAYDEKNDKNMELQLFCS